MSSFSRRGIGTAKAETAELERLRAGYKQACLDIETLQAEREAERSREEVVRRQLDLRLTEARRVEQEAQTLRDKLHLATARERRADYMRQRSNVFADRVHLFVKELEVESGGYYELNRRLSTGRTRLPFAHIRQIAGNFGLDCFHLGAGADGLVAAGCGGQYRSFIVLDADGEDSLIVPRKVDGWGDDIEWPMHCESITNGEHFIVLEDEDSPHLVNNFDLFRQVVGV